MRRHAISVFCALAAFAVFAGRIELKTPGAKCVVDTHGARVISYATGKLGEFLWNDEPVQIRDAVWAHGGIPLCWPTFGQAEDKSWHGVAWRKEFEVVSRSEAPGRCVAVFRLKLPEAVLTYSVALTDETLELGLETLNATNRVISFASAFHPFFRVGERDRTWVTGASNVPFAVTHSIDGDLPGPKGAVKRYSIADKALDRTLSLSATGSDGLCVWNPGDDTEFPGRIPKDAWRRFVCVEPSAGSPTRRTLEPGARHRLTLTLRPKKGSAVAGLAGGR